MPKVVRLETTADVQDHPDAGGVSISARHEAVLDDGGRVVLLDGRGWTASLRGSGSGRMDPWALTSEAEIAATARAVVGPDEAYGERTQPEMDSAHWGALAETLRAHGLAADADALRRLPHDVVLTDRLRGRIASPPNGSSRPPS